MVFDGRIYKNKVNILAISSNQTRCLWMVNCLGLRINFLFIIKNVHSKKSKIRKHINNINQPLNRKLSIFIPLYPETIIYMF